MKTANEILTALKLQRNKNTIAYASKLASYFSFVQTIKADIKEAVITDTDLTVNDAGKLMELPQLKGDYVQHSLYSFMGNDAAYQELVKHENRLSADLRQDVEILWEKRKNKNNTALESEIETLRNDISEIEKNKESLLSAEKIRLQDSCPDIAQMRKALNLFNGNRIMIDTGNGIYSFIVPIENKYYTALCDILGLQSEAAKIELVNPILKIVTYDNVMEKIKKAARFTSKDTLRPSMQSICLNFSDKGLQVVATDAHKLYYSPFFGGEISTGIGWNDIQKCEPMELLIAPESISALIKSKPDNNKALEINVYSEDKAVINGIEVNLLAGVKYPNYKCVIPEYKHKMTFERKGLINITKQLLPFANRQTNQVAFHLNGNIEATAQDVDFSNELTKQMKYVSKDFIDTDIAFNGNFLIETLNAFTVNELAMYSDGKANQAAIFTDNTDTVLLMPLMMNN